MDKICIKPTMKCPYNCPTCTERRNLYEEIGRSVEFKYDKWINIIDQSYEMGCRKITISGGEPLLYNKLIDIIKYCKNKNFTRIAMNTSGLLLNKKMCNDIFNSGLTSICISLTNFSAKKYIESKGITNKKCFDTVIDNILYFNNNKPKYLHSDNMIFFTKLNLFDLPFIIKRAELYKFDGLFMDLLEGNFNDNTYRINNADIELFIDKFLTKIDTKYHKNIINILTHSTKYPYYNSNDVKCNIPGNFCIILPNGDVHPCNVFEYSHEECFNLYDYDFSLSSIFNSDKMKIFIKNKSLYCSRCPMNFGEQLMLI